MMKKSMKKLLSVVLSLAMILTSVVYYSSDVKADTLTADEIDSIAGNGTMTNMISGKNADVYPQCVEGNVSNLTNGGLDNASGKAALGKTGWDYSGDTYAIYDLGNYYDASTIDEIVVVYLLTNDAANVRGKTYNIQYSVDRVNWNTIKSSETITAQDLLDDNALVDDVSGNTGSVRYIKIDYPSSNTYGIQITEIAVLAQNPQVAELDQCTDPASVQVSAVGLGGISLEITANQGQEDYHYAVHLDSPSGTVLKYDCQAGVEYNLENIPGGTHKFYVKSVHPSKSESTGIESDSVAINTYETLAADSSYNYALGKDVLLSSGSSTEGNGSITDGIISGSNYQTSDKGKANSWLGVDLAEEYKASSFEAIGIWFRVNGSGNAYPNTGGLKAQYSADGDEWLDAKVMTQTEFNEQRKDTAPFGVIIDVSEATGTVRYARVLIPQSLGWGAQVSELAVFDLDNSVEKAQSVVVDNPSELTAAATSYNTITGNIVAGENQDGYKYNIYLDGKLYLSNADAGNYSIDAPAGTYEVTCKSFYNEHFSSGISAGTVTVTDGFSYSSETGTGVYADTSENGNNYITFNGKTVPGVTATTSNGNAGNAIDYNGGSRWEASASDPQWITVDLGSIKPVKEIDLWWETASAKDFTVDVSTDGTNYKSVVFVSGAASGNNRRDSIVLTNEVNTRYVRIYDTARTTQWGHSIYEMAVYGSEELPYKEVSDYIEDGVRVAPAAPQGKLFAGWYTDDTCTTAYTAETGTAYAKFVDENVFKCADQEDDDTTPTAVRFVSTIDTTNYSEIGFQIVGKYDSENNNINVEKSVKTIYNTIKAAGETMLPTTFSDESTYFFAYTIRGLEAGKKLDVTCTPYFVTLDGTKVTGLAHDCVLN